MNRRTWLNNWLKPANLIALGVLIVTALGVSQAMKTPTEVPVNNTQVITGKENCEINGAEQTISGNVQAAQEIDCDKSKIIDPTQTQTE